MTVPAPSLRSPITNPLAPPWVSEETGLSARVLYGWRVRGWLTPPGDGCRPGTGRAFDWAGAIPQVVWLARLDPKLRLDPGSTLSHHWLDDEDAAAGWRLRAAEARYGYRLGGERWEPLARQRSVLRLFREANQTGCILTIAQVR